MRWLVVWAAAVSLVACGGDDSSGGRSASDASGGSAHYIRWDVDGTHDEVTSSATARVDLGNLQGGGADDNHHAITIAVLSVSTGTFAVGTGGASMLYNEASLTWLGDQLSSNGQITVSEFGDGEVSGTFEAELRPYGDATGNRKISNGAFNLSY
ncbi:MAG TPA: hypothetical protein VGM90_09865 [Kofleriaceae bacterium]|jgi:hypothetical protein